MPEEIPNNMKDSWFFDKSFNGMSDENFDDILKFFDFPLEDVEANVVEEDWGAKFNHLEVPCFDAFSASSAAGFFGKTQNEKPQFGNGLPVSYNGVSPIKQEAEIAGPSYGKTIRNQNVSFNEKVLHQFQTYSPVSVFENSSSSSVEIPNFDIPAFPVKRARSKRCQRTTFGPLFSFSFFHNSQALQQYQGEPTPESSYSETRRSAWKHLNRTKKQRKKDLSLLSGDVEMKQSSSQEPVSHRKCTHCEITKTPQWREGPMGPKTLCNACGVRYRSGRLFPEYRPAASPTFVASVHSNSHKKVLEMRGGRGVPEGVQDSIPGSSNLAGNYVG